jgi:hypothetical protein
VIISRRIRARDAALPANGNLYRWGRCSILSQMSLNIDL